MFESNVGAQLHSAGEEGRTDLTGQADVQVPPLDVLKHVFAQLLLVAAVGAVPNFGAGLNGGGVERGTVKRNNNSKRSGQVPVMCRA